MSNFKIIITILFVGFVVAIIWLISPDKKADNRKKYLASVNLNITGIVNKVMPLRDEDHGYGVIYLRNFTSNKGNNYECAYKGTYLFCKIKNNEVIIVTPGITEINPNDSVSYNTNTLRYECYRKRKLIIKNGIAINESDDFYNRLNINGYLNFYYYRK